MINGGWKKITTMESWHLSLNRMSPKELSKACQNARKEFASFKNCIQKRNTGYEIQQSYAVEPLLDNEFKYKQRN